MTPTRLIPSFFSARAANNALYQNKTHAVQQKNGYSIHLVGAGLQGKWHGKAECLGSLQINHEFKLGRLLNGQVRWLGAFENSGGVNAKLAISICSLCRS